MTGQFPPPYPLKKSSTSNSAPVWHPINVDDDEYLILITEEHDDHVPAPLPDSDSTSQSSVSDNQDEITLPGNLVQSKSDEASGEDSEDTDSEDKDSEDKYSEDKDSETDESDEDDSTEHDAQAVVTHEHNEEDNTPERLLQGRKPKLHDHISFLHKDLLTWVNARLISNELRGWKNYYNIVYSDGEEDGLYLIPNERWTFREPDEPEASPQHIQQADGNDDPDSLTPSPETTPEHQATPSETGARAKTDVRLNYGGYLSTSSPDISPERRNKTDTESMEWDALGTHFDTPPRHLNHPVSYNFDLDKAAYLDLLLPILSSPELSVQPAGELDLLQAADLQLRLPVSSTPNSPRRQRISHCRRSLPLESKDGAKKTTPKFLSRLNPFKKKPPDGK